MIERKRKRKERERVRERERERGGGGGGGTRYTNLLNVVDLISSILRICFHPHDRCQLSVAHYE